MAVLYKPFQSILPSKTGKKLFYPRVVLVGNVGTDQVAREISEYSSLSKGDSKNVIDNLIKVIANHLQASESVTLDGLGTFRLVMKSNNRGVESAEEVSAAQSALTVRFMPAITRNPDRSLATRSMTAGAHCVPYNKKTVSGSENDPGTGGGNTGGDDMNDNPLG